MRWLLLLFLILPALEIGVFIWVGDMIGPWWVVALIIITGMLGIMIARQQGFETWNRARQAIQLGQAPTEYIIDGICIFIGGVFLFAPGFITDIAGFMFVLPITRGWFRYFVIRFIGRIIERNGGIFRRLYKIKSSWF